MSRRIWLTVGALAIAMLCLVVVLVAGALFSVGVSRSPVIQITATPDTRPTAAELAYLEEARSILANVGATANELETLFERPQFANEAWTDAVRLRLNRFTQAYNRAKAIRPPARYEAVHAKMLRALDQMDHGATLWQRGLTLKNPDDLNLGNAEFAKAVPFLREATDMVERARAGGSP